MFLTMADYAAIVESWKNRTKANRDMLLTYAEIYKAIENGHIEAKEEALDTLAIMTDEDWCSWVEYREKMNRRRAKSKMT